MMSGEGGGSMHDRPQDAGVRLLQAEVLWNRSLGPGYRRLGLATGDTFERAAPGQFVMLGILPEGPRLLRRPFSIHRRIAPPDGPAGIELLYRVVGATTRAMAALGPGAQVDLIGPLGRGFAVPGDARRVILAAGGVGAAPILFLAETLAARGPVAGLRVFLGGRGRADVLCREDFERLGLPVTVTTDDGSLGDRCLVTEPLTLAAAASPPEMICACGPPGMLRCVAELAAARSIPCQVSIETLMACGLGACLGCAVALRGRPARYRHACVDGPVFDAAGLDWGVQ